MEAQAGKARVRTQLAHKEHFLVIRAQATSVEIGAAVTPVAPLDSPGCIINQ
jgi:hypothetical protein